MGDQAPTPTNILRGHRAQIHAATFLRHNSRLATGDADGYVALWDLAIMRPRAVWRAHESALLSVEGWGSDRIITHGRDHKLIVWKMGEEDEARMSIVLPVEAVSTPRPQPWVLHLLNVNTMNFCAFGSCEPSDIKFDGVDETTELLISVPNTLESESIDIYALPSQSRICTIDPGKGNGMAMSLDLVNVKGTLSLIAAFENGYASVHRLQEDGQWITTYRSQAHTQPILSVSVHPNHEYFLTSSADAVIAKHPIPATQQDAPPEFDPSNRIIEEVDDKPQQRGESFLSAQLKATSAAQKGKFKSRLKPWDTTLKKVNTKHAGQQGLEIRSDGRIFATSGWDSNVRVYSCKTLKELAVLQWHSVGCYTVAFAKVEETDQPSSATKPSGGLVSGSERVGDLAMESAVAKEDTSVIARNSGKSSIVSVKDRRITKARTAHWVAAGAKDGKVSLWTVY